MNKSQNRSRGNRRSQGNITPKKVNNHIIEDLVDSEGEEASFSEFKGMMIKMFKELKGDIQKQFNEFQESMDKKLEKTQKQLNELKEVTSK
jgi:hypothetical protein